MPTITIATPARTPSHRRAVALRLTRWLADHEGIDPAHVIVRFPPTPEQTVFSGGMPMDTLPAGNGSLQHASVTCCVGPERDEGFRSGLAAEIADALGATKDTPFLYIEFRPTPRDHVYLWRRGELQRADLATSTSEYDQETR
ncbi:hypothetical protein RIF23_14570 [Lipingzhangella sp. LS1_29]|uniref:Phenylpyruvate tautomerase PptA (4-oxalocrotonate tautomerase family) n=1 Tax=Lipingzhangella rawalii TaxID=2055835 RepID=A0ABU2H9K8_9ACTN|nr:hypothetical protein [Lipingzhangella rawalii]MDS1271520.1 hypothetical protein [Lipingzhangella rawalii]